jgi:hypothetical protein
VAIETFASDRPPAADRAVLVSPAVWGWSSQPPPYQVLLWLTAHIAGPSVLHAPDFVAHNIRATDNTDELIRMGHDPLVSRSARADALYGLVNLMQRAWTDIGKIAVPAADLAGVHDQIIPRTPQLQAARRLKPVDRSAYYPNGWHLLLVDRQGEVVERHRKLHPRSGRPAAVRNADHSRRAHARQRADRASRFNRAVTGAGSRS